LFNVAIYVDGKEISTPPQCHVERKKETGFIAAVSISKIMTTMIRPLAAF